MCMYVYVYIYRSQSQPFSDEIGRVLAKLNRIPRVRLRKRVE